MTAGLFVRYTTLEEGRSPNNDSHVVKVITSSVWFLNQESHPCIDLLVSPDNFKNEMTEQFEKVNCIQDCRLFAVCSLSPDNARLDLATIAQNVVQVDEWD